MTLGDALELGESVAVAEGLWSGVMVGFCEALALGDRVAVWVGLWSGVWVADAVGLWSAVWVALGVALTVSLVDSVGLAVADTVIVRVSVTDPVDCSVNVGLADRVTVRDCVDVRGGDTVELLVHVGVELAAGEAVNVRVSVTDPVDCSVKLGLAVKVLVGECVGL